MVVFAADVIEVLLSKRKPDPVLVVHPDLVEPGLCTLQRLELVPGFGIWTVLIIGSIASQERSMTLEIYAHVLPDMQENAAATLSTLLHPPHTPSEQRA